MEKTLIATHDGSFHADEVFAVATLRLIYPDAEVIRTRDEEVLERVNIRVDVGRKYNSQTNDFDHHQLDFNEKRENEIPYASAGLIWKHYGPKITSQEVLDILDEKLFQYVDSIDSGITPFTVDIAKPFDVCDIIDAFNPSWPNYSIEATNDGFNNAVELASSIIKREISQVEGKLKARDTLRDIIKNNKNKDFLVLEEYIPWKKSVVGKTDLKYVIYKGTLNKNWSSSAVTDKPGSFKSVKPFPKEWAGLEGKELEEMTGVKGAIFCHKALFLCVADSKEGAIKLTELALANKE